MIFSQYSQFTVEFSNSPLCVIKSVHVNYYSSFCYCDFIFPHIDTWRQISALVLVVTTGISLAAREQDRVDFLPGLDLDEQPQFNHYAGYLNASGANKFFYW